MQSIYGHFSLNTAVFAEAGENLIFEIALIHIYDTDNNFINIFLPNIWQFN